MVKCGLTFREVFDSLRTRIVSGEFTDRLPSLSVLRASYGVSGDTVKKALSLLKEHRFVYGHQGKGIFINQTSEVNPLTQKTVAVFLREDTSTIYFMMQILNRMRLLLEKERCNLIFLNTLSQIAAFAEQFDVLVLCNQFDQGWPAEILALDPEKVISCNCRCLPGGHTVNSDNVLGGRLAAEWLYSHGCRRIGVLYGFDIDDETSYLRQRTKGACQFAEDHSELQVVVSEFQISETNPFVSGPVERLLDMEPDGIFMTLDTMSFRVYECCQRRGLKIGKDILLIGFDNAPFCSELQPMLSSILEKPVEIGSGIVDMIRSILCGVVPMAKKAVPPCIVDRTGARAEVFQRGSEVVHSWKKRPVFNSVIF